LFYKYNIRLSAKEILSRKKNFKLSDEIRDELKALGVEIKDNKDGSTDYNLL